MLRVLLAINTPLSRDRHCNLVVCVSVVAIFALLCSAAYGDQRAHGLPAAPHLLGFGTLTVGGSGRHITPPSTTVITVSSLADRGRGTLRECIEFDQPRTCIFTVGGEIILKTPLRIRHPYITIAGQSAPSPGITISHSALQIKSHDILIQHISFRPGDCTHGTKPMERDAISIGSEKGSDVFNVVIDHVSATWAVDENITIWYPTSHDITISNSLIAEGLHESLHPKGPHSKGIMIGPKSKNITLIRNLIALNHERNPYIQGGSTTETINNVIYGWGSAGPWCLSNLSDTGVNTSKTIASFRGNRYIPGPKSYIAFFLHTRHLSQNSEIFLHDNTMTYTTGLKQENRRLKSTSPMDVAPSSTIPNAKILSSTVIERHVLQNVGSRPWDRSRHDTAIIKKVRGRRGTLRNKSPRCQPHSPSIREKYDATLKPSQHHIATYPVIEKEGYTALERWLHAIH
jgi:hypothetical protein